MRMENLKRASRVVVAFLILASSGCMRRDGQNSDCNWPGVAPSQTSTPRQVSADAEFAEDMAIRYGDVHFGNDPGRADAIRRCQAKLYQEIAKTHKVSVAEVEQSVGRNREHIDAATLLGYLALAWAIAFLVSRLIWQKYPPGEHGWMAGVVMCSFLGILFAFGSTILGEMLAWVVAGYRIGNDPLSNRAFRFWWVFHRREMFALLLVAFGIAATWTGRVASRGRKDPACPGDA